MPDNAVTCTHLEMIHAVSPTAAGCDGIAVTYVFFPSRIKGLPDLETGERVPPGAVERVFGGAVCLAAGAVCVWQFMRRMRQTDRSE